MIDFSEHSLSLRMLLTPDWKSIIQKTVCLKLIEQWYPDILALSALFESLGVSEHYETISGPGKKHVQTLRRRHEADLTVSVASSKCGNNNIAFFAMIIVFEL
jgi:hypothetical protein